MKIVVCGGRDYVDGFTFFAVMNELHEAYGFEVIVHGCARGADRLADAWASANGVLVIRYPADWDAFGKRAGPIRNRRMIERERPEMVVAFPGGSGTADMREQARLAEIPVIEVSRSGDWREL